MKGRNEEDEFDLEWADDAVLSPDNEIPPATLHYEVTPQEAGRRLDLFLAERKPYFTRSHLQKLVESGQVRVNERPAKAGQRLKAADQIVLEVPPPARLEVLAENIPLDIIFEDEDILVVNKPRGMVVHPAVGNYSGTLVNALLAHCRDLAGINDVLRPGIVHRLDKDTTGLLVVAKNDLAYQGLAVQIRTRTLKREYLALVEGNLAVDRGSVDAPIGRHTRHRQRMAVIKEGRPAITHFWVQKRFAGYTYLTLRLETGRTHQIRVHMAYLGHPVVADPLYGKPKNPFGLTGQALHAAALGLIHPRTHHPLEFSAPLPADFAAALESLQQKLLP